MCDVQVQVSSSQHAALAKLAEKYCLQNILEILNKATLEELRAINNWLKSLDLDPGEEGRSSAGAQRAEKEKGNPDYPTLSDLEDDSPEEEECSPLSDSELDEENVNRERI